MARMSKTQSLNVHAKRRAALRYEVNLNGHDLREIVNLIQRGKATLIERQSLRVTKWLLRLPRAGQAAIIVYDNKRQTVVTVLPKEALPHPSTPLGARVRALNLPRADASAMLTQIQDGQAKFVGKRLDGTSEYLVRNPSTGDEIAVLYHRGGKEIDAVLTMPEPDVTTQPEYKMEKTSQGSPLHC